jgi:hypothetical protein
MTTLQSASQIMESTIQSGRTLNAHSISEVARTAEGEALIQRSLKAVMEGAAFKGSHRSAQFLEHVVRQTAKGNIDGLKERVIGVELFGRRPSYDTGEDAIVRVTASDVRKRLHQHYSHAGQASEVTIILPPGKYIPELICNGSTHKEAEPLSQTQDVTANAHTDPSPSSLAASTPAILTPSPDAPLPTMSHPETETRRKTTATQPFDWRYWSLPLAGGVALAIGLILVIASGSGVIPRRNLAVRAPLHAAPWASILNSARPLQIVASDPNIEEIQRISQSTVELSDYANERYLPKDTSHLSAEDIRFIKDILRGNKISTFDGSIMAGIVSLLVPGQTRPTIRGARDIRIQDIETNDNLIFLGSPLSNPWTSMYDPILDFRFARDEHTQREFIHNVHPLSGEQSEYLPTAGGFDTGVSYATISLFQHPGHDGRILIVAGTNGEGTDAAGSVITDPTRWEWLLAPCHLGSTGAQQSLQLLLQLGNMAGSAKDVKIVACHILGHTS